ncbi:MAG: LysM peptidoglycan-binding domain-containing protein [Alphaproteobacteria bacterium]|nr:LysM peptidoglycan-binding domain-containing protein [Alphaproteobacteria bacterium]
MYTFWIGTMPLPITPGQLEIKTPSKNKTVTLINEGEVSLLKKSGLKEISFKALLPQTKYPFANYNLGAYDATAFIVALKTLDASKIPFPFVVTRMTPKGKPLFFTSMMVTLEDYTLDEDSENGLDVILNITLKEYKYYGTTIFKEVVDAEGRKAMETTKTRDTASKVIPKTYTVKKGDTLWAIAKKELGDGQKYKDLAKLNNISNPNKIQIGQVIRLQ